MKPEPRPAPPHRQSLCIQTSSASSSGSAFPSPGPLRTPLSFRTSFLLCEAAMMVVPNLKAFGRDLCDAGHLNQPRLTTGPAFQLFPVLSRSKFFSLYSDDLFILAVLASSLDYSRSCPHLHCLLSVGLVNLSIILLWFSVPPSHLLSPCMTLKALSSQARGRADLTYLLPVTVLWALCPPFWLCSSNLLLPWHILIFPPSFPLCMWIPGEVLMKTHWVAVCPFSLFSQCMPYCNFVGSSAVFSFSSLACPSLSPHSQMTESIFRTQKIAKLSFTLSVCWHPLPPPEPPQFRSYPYHLLTWYTGQLINLHLHLLIYKMEVFIVPTLKGYFEV